MKLMLQKHGLPDEGDLVMCIVTKVHFHSIFVDIIEFDNLQGMIHISEVSPGRIRNIRDFVKEGKTVICKVLRVNQERGQVDLSLRRVNDNQKRQKVNEIKQEQVAEKIIEFVAKEQKIEPEKLFKEVNDAVTKHYDSIFQSFANVVENNYKLEKAGVSKKYADALEVIVKQRIKPEKVEIKGHFKVSSFAPEGVDLIKHAFEEGKKIKGDFKMSYVGGGVYDLLVTDKDYKSAEKVLSELTETVLGKLDDPETTSEFIRINTK